MSPPEQVYLPQQEVGRRMLPEGRGRRARQPGGGEPERGGDHLITARGDRHLEVDVYDLSHIDDVVRSDGTVRRPRQRETPVRVSVETVRIVNGLPAAFA